MESVSFDGVNISDMFTVIGTRGVASPVVQTVEVSGRDGIVPKGVVYGCPTVALTFVTDSGDGLKVSEARRQLSAMLNVKEPKKLQFGDDSGLYYMAQPDGPLDWVQFTRTGRLVVPFLVPSPAMYGEERSVTVPSGGSVTFNVMGTYPTRPTVYASAAKSGSSSPNAWGVTLDSTDWMYVLTGSSSTAKTVLIDCDSRQCKLAGQTALPTLDSDWFVLEPGSHTIANSQGSGSCTVTWVERWLA